MSIHDPVAILEVVILEWDSRPSGTGQS